MLTKLGIFSLSSTLARSSLEILTSNSVKIGGGEVEAVDAKDVVDKDSFICVTKSSCLSSICLNF